MCAIACLVSLLSSVFAGNRLFLKEQSVSYGHLTVERLAS